MEKDTLKLSTTELAKRVGLSRSYLYKKAKTIGLELNGEYTQSDLERLKSSSKRHKKSASRHNDTRVSETPEGDKNSPLERELKNQIVSLKKQLSVKDEQLKMKDKQIDMANQLADQAQKLQADIQTKLETKNQELLAVKEQKKSFWHRIFGK